MELRELTDPTDPDLGGLARLMSAVFPDPNTVLGLDRLQEFLAANQAHALRQFHVLVAINSTDPNRVSGGSVFSYVATSNCGFSEYILADASARGHGLGRQLFEARKALLDADARQHGHQRCHGLFIEVDSPLRVPQNFADIERETALDTLERLRLFAHLGFRQVEVPYVQPPLAPTKAPIDYLDLLFAPWDPQTPPLAEIPATWIFDTLDPIWSAWSPLTAATHLATLKRQVQTTEVQLRDLATSATRN